MPVFPYSECVFPAKPLGGGGSMFFVEMYEHLAVAARLENVSLFFQAAADLGVVEDLAVMQGPHVPRLVAHRLVPVLGIDDGKAAHAERDARSMPYSTRIWPSVSKRMSHSEKGLRFQGRARLAPELNDSADAAHACRRPYKPGSRGVTTRAAGLSTDRPVASRSRRNNCRARWCVRRYAIALASGDRGSRRMADTT